MAIILRDSTGQAWSLTILEDGRLQAVTTDAGTETASGDDITVAEVIHATAQDLRQQLADSGADASILIDYTNRVHKQLLRASRWRFLLSEVKEFTTVEGVSDYWIGPSASLPVGMQDSGLNLSDVSSIQRGSVVDRTNDRPLFPTNEKPLGDTWEQSGLERVYRHDGSTPHVLSVYPPTLKPAVIQFRYYKQINDLTAAGHALQVPRRYKDIVVEGVNARAFRYLKQWEDASTSFQLFQAGIREIIRDYNLHPRGPEFIRPDSTSLKGSGPLATFDDLFIRS